jgi:hypothetical protein
VERSGFFLLAGFHRGWLWVLWKCKRKRTARE